MAALDLDWKGMWHDYVSWSKDDTDMTKRDMGRTRAQMAARGIRVGSNTWQTMQDNLQEELANSQNEVESGATVEGLKSEYNREYQRAYKNWEGDDQPSWDPNPKREFSFPGFKEWGIGRFGLPEGVDGLDPEWRVGEAGPYHEPLVKPNTDGRVGDTLSAYPSDPNFGIQGYEHPDVMDPIVGRKPSAPWLQVE